jgi:hypothetical protein
LLSRILSRASDLVREGRRLANVPKALSDLALSGETDLDAYLELDDTVLWNAISAWRTVKDPVLGDLCQRLHARRLFKTLRFYEPSARPDAYAEASEVARELVRARGLDPDVYVGLDRATLVPFDEASAGLRVIFPNGITRAPGDVSFVLGRLRGQRLEQVRLIFPAEIRDELHVKVDHLRKIER